MVLSLRISYNNAINVQFTGEERDCADWYHFKPYADTLFTYETLERNNNFQRIGLLNHCGRPSYTRCLMWRFGSSRMEEALSNIKFAAVFSRDSMEDIMFMIRPIVKRSL